MSAIAPYLPEASISANEPGSGEVIIDFGTNWCGYCQAAASCIADALIAYPQVRHLKVEDGPGRPLGRQFRVKLWPTLVLLRDGQEIGRVVRPADVSDIDALLNQ